MSSNIVIRILPMQISQAWEAIKFAAVQAEEIAQKNVQPYLNELLSSLLSDKAQCFLRLGDDRTLLGLMITRILIDKITNEKNLLIQSLYSWKSLNNEEWQNDLKLIKAFAEQEQCKWISFESMNPRVWQLAEAIGFRENLRKFIFEV